MHIIIAVITAIAGLIWALNSLQRAGFDLNSLNPFYWARRKRWEEKQINPLYAVETAREMAALLMFAVLRQSGDPTEEQKSFLLKLYQDALKFNEKESADMYQVSSHLLSTDPNYMHKVGEIIAPSAAVITDSQINSIPSLINKVATHANTPNDVQLKFMSDVEEIFRDMRGH